MEFLKNPRNTPKMGLCEKLSLPPSRTAKRVITILVYLYVRIQLQTQIHIHIINTGRLYSGDYTAENYYNAINHYYDVP